MLKTLQSPTRHLGFEFDLMTFEEEGMKEAFLPVFPCSEDSKRRIVSHDKSSERVFQ
jgi:hypothetical protein